MQMQHGGEVSCWRASRIKKLSSRKEQAMKRGLWKVKVPRTAQRVPIGEAQLARLCALDSELDELLAVALGGRMLQQHVPDAHCV